MDSFIAIAVTIFGCIVILAGAVILVIGIRMRRREKRHCIESAVGIVKKIEYSYSDRPDETNSVLYGLRLLVNFEGTEYDVFNEEYSSSCKYRVGDAVPIMLNPDDPNEYYINDGSTGSIHLICVGAGMIVAGAFIMKYFR